MDNKETTRYEAAGGSLLRCEEPAARLEDFGARALTDVELLALVLGGNAVRAMATARATLATCGGSLREVARWTACESSASVAGLTETSARRVAASFELARRMVAEEVARNGEALTRPEAVARYLSARLVGVEVEKFFVLALDRKNKLVRCVELTSGTATSALAHPGEVLRAVIMAGGVAFIVAHNHPSGDPAPSAADVQLTRVVREAARAVDVAFLDHVICGRAVADPLGRGFYSFREAGAI